jgi:hypothetical protein
LTHFSERVKPSLSVMDEGNAMDATPRRARLFDAAWFMFWLTLSSCWCWTAARQLGATFDEPVYIARGLDFWHTGSHRGLMVLGTMPLAIDLTTLPLYVMERWQGTSIDPVADLETVLPWARSMTLVFWFLLLWYGRSLGRDVAGPWGGRLAVAFLACEPTLLAHASLATTDLATTACLLAFTYHFKTNRSRAWIFRIAIPGLWVAATLLSKASGLVFVPLCMLVVELERLIQLRRNTNLPNQAHSPSWRSRASATIAFLKNDCRPLCLDAMQIGVLGLVLTFVYCGSEWQRQPSFVAWANDLPAGHLHNAMTWTADHLRIFSNAGEGIVRQVKHNIRGHGTYLLGVVADRALWYYFPVLLTIKLSLPLLFWPIVVLVLKPRALVSYVGFIALAMLLFSFNCRVQIGIRLVLPLVAFLIVAAAGSVVGALRDWSARLVNGRRLAPAFCVFLVALGLGWSTLASAAVWPEGLCYTNELWGGTANGWLAASDSNYDWGQGLKELARWQNDQRVPLDVWYFGSDPLLDKMPVHEIKFHLIPVAGPEDVLTRVRGHRLAVGTTLLRGSMSTVMKSGIPVPAECYWRVIHFLDGREPIARTSTFLIYDFANEPPASGPLTARD